MKILTILISSLAWLLAACTTAASMTPQIPSETQKASATITQSPSLTSTPLPSQTLTPAPSHTNTPRPSQTFTYTPTPTTDWNAIYQEMKSAVMTATPAALSEVHISPDGKWRVELIQYGCVDIGADEGGKNSYEQLRLVNIEDGKETIITDQLQYCEGIGAAGLGFVYWSPNSRDLYYTDSAYGVPDGGGMAWYRSLYRYKVGSGKTIALRWGPLAPDGVTMAYPDQQELVVYLWDLDEGEIARIPSSLSPSSPWPGIFGIAWSPDGKSLVYIEAENSDGIDGKSWIILLDMATFERKAIFQSESGQMCCLKWQTKDQIQYRLNNEVNNLNLPPDAGNELKPTSLWCERPDDLQQTKVAISRLPGAPQSFCIVWAESATPVSGYRVELKYDGSGEVFDYTAGPYGTQWIVPFEYQPLLDESQEQFISRHSYNISIFALTSAGESLLGATAVEVDNPDYLSLPTATPTP